MDHSGDLMVLEHLRQRRRWYRLPLRIGNTRPPESAPSIRAAWRISSARPQSGTRCPRFAFIRAAEIVHTRSVELISVHVARRTSAA